MCSMLTQNAATLAACARHDGNKVLQVDVRMWLKFFGAILHSSVKQDTIMQQLLKDRALNNQQLAASGQQPAASSQQSAASNNQQLASSNQQQSAANNQQPATISSQQRSAAPQGQEHD